jgi:hypothetical protein
MERAINLGAVVLLLACPTLLGCGGGSTAHGDYVGTWHYDSVNVAQVNCGGTNVFTVAPVADKVLQDGVAHAIVDTSVSPLDSATECDFGFDVKGTTATMAANQTCTLNALIVDPTQLPVVTPTQWRFTLLGKNSAEEVGSANMTNVPLTDASNNQVLAPCDYSLMARLTRVATN